jgi:hypothetical protein
MGNFFTDSKIKEIVKDNPQSFAAMAYRLGRKEALMELMTPETLKILIEHRKANK